MATQPETPEPLSPSQQVILDALRSFRDRSVPRGGVYVDEGVGGGVVEIIGRRSDGTQTARIALDIADWSQEDIVGISRWLDRKIARRERRHIKALP